MVELFSRFQGGSLALAQISLPGAALYYAGLLSLAWAGYTGRLQPLISRFGVTASVPSLARRLSPALAGLLLVATSVLIWRLALSAPDGRLHLTVLDTNTDGASGEALLIESPSGRFILVGGGPSGNRLSDALGRRLPPRCSSSSLLARAQMPSTSAGTSPRPHSAVPMPARYAPMAKNPCWPNDIWPQMATR